MGIVYRIPRWLPTQRRFWEMVRLPAGEQTEERMRICAYAGGWGSGKSTVLKWLLMDYLTCFPGLKALLVRKTLTSLELTTQQEFLFEMTEGNQGTPDQDVNVAELFKESWNEKKKLYVHVNGSSLVFGGLDKPAKWSSSQYGLICVEEASEIVAKDLTYLKSRLRQKSPPCKHCEGVGCSACGETGTLWGPDYVRALVLVLNHVPSTHFVYKHFVGTAEEPKKPGYQIAETSSWENAPQNGGFLPRGYLESIAETEDEGTVSVFMGGRWGVMKSGVPVYPFIPQIAGQPWQERSCKFIPGRPLYLSFDFGYRFPAVLVHQMQMWGRHRVLAEFSIEKSQTDMLCRALLSMLAERFPGFELARAAYGDPAGWANRSEGVADAVTVERILNVRFRSIPSTRNTKELRRKILAKRMRETLGNEPAFAVDVSCSTLLEALQGQYRYPEVKSTFERENYREEPLEEHPWCDYAHSLEYFILCHYREEILLMRRQQAGAQEERVPGYRVRG